MFAHSGSNIRLKWPRKALLNIFKIRFGSFHLHPGYTYFCILFNNCLASSSPAPPKTSISYLPKTQHDSIQPNPKLNFFSAAMIVKAFRCPTSPQTSKFFPTNMGSLSKITFNIAFTVGEDIKRFKFTQKHVDFILHPKYGTQPDQARLFPKLQASELFFGKCAKEKIQEDKEFLNPPLTTGSIYFTTQDQYRPI